MTSQIALNAARYRFYIRVTAPLRLPDYAGSTLRGVFGHALLQVCGLSPTDRDKNTLLFQQSPYVDVFAPQKAAPGISLNNLAQLPVPYVIEAPLDQVQTHKINERFSFDLVLSGSALRHLSTIILAWRRAFLRGVGNGDGKGELMRVECISPDGLATIIYSEEQPRIAPHITRIVAPDFRSADSDGRDVHLLLETPLRLQQRGKLLGPREMTASIFLRSLIRRITLQIQMQQPDSWPLERIRQLNELADKVTDDRRLIWQDWERYSTRQKQTMKLGGVTGHWLIRKVPVDLLPFIYLGQWLHLGKETSFGLGKYKWLSTPWQPVSTIQNNTESRTYV